MYKAMNCQLLRRKIVRRLLQAIAEYRLAVVSAPMGYGKTTIARQFAEAEKKTTYFFAIPAESEDADSLWDALWREMAERGMPGAVALRRGGFPKNSLQARSAVDILAASAPAVLILDDYHNCRDADMTAFVETLIRHDEGGLRLLLLSRTLPDMGLEELQVKEMAVVYDQELLAFSETETKEYFFLNGVDDNDLAQSAWKYSEGWITALWLCLRSSQVGGDMPPAGDIESALGRVVYASYSRAEQELLMQLSVLDYFSSGEAAALTLDRNARQRIHRIRNKNAFLIHDVVRHRYQFHSIFQAFLQKRLEASPTLNTPSLLRRAAECHAARREFMAAYRLLVRAGREEDKERLLEILASLGGERMSDLQWEELHVAVQAIPWRVRLRQPLGYLAYVWQYIEMAGESFDFRTLREAERRFNAAENIAAGMKRRLAGEIEFIRGCLAFNDYDLVTWHYVRAHELLAGPSFIFYKRASWSFGSPSPNFVGHRTPGRFSQLKTEMKKHREKFVAVTGGSGTGGDLAVEADYHLERGEFPEAERLLTDVGELIDGRENITTHLIASFSRARLLAAKGRGTEAVALLRDAAPGIEDEDMFEQILCRDLALGYVLACLGRTDGLPRWLADGDVHGSPYGVVQLQSLSRTIYGKILLARDDYHGLAELVESSPDGFGPLPTPFSTIHVRIFQAILARRRRDTAVALDILGKALELSRPDGIVLCYAEYGDRLLPLLRSLRRTRSDDGHLRAIAALTERVVRSPDGNRFRKTLLTPREKKILQLVSLGKTNPGIAHSLRVTEVTVKKTLSHAYVKLGANNRAEAASRFEALYGRKNGPAGPEHAAPDGRGAAGDAVPSKDKNAFRRLPEIDALVAKSFLAGRPAKDRDLLMRISVLEDFSVDDAAALAGDEDVVARIRNFQRRDGIVEHDVTTNRYRLHRLTREYLERELAASDIDLPSLYRAAGECCIRRGDVDAAGRLLLKTGKEEDLVRALQLFLLPEAVGTGALRDEEILNAVRGFSWRVRLKQPMGYLAFLWNCMGAGAGAGAVARSLEEAEFKFLRAKHAAEFGRRLKGEMALLQASLRFNDMEAVWKGYERAAAILKKPSLLLSPCRSWSFGSPHLSFLCLRIGGKFAAMVKRALAAEKLVAALTDYPCNGEATALEAEYRLERGEFELAEQRLAENEAAAGSGEVAAAIRARFVRARFFLAQGGADEAAQALLELRPLVAESGREGDWESLELALGYIRAAPERPEGAPQWLCGESGTPIPKHLSLRTPLLLVVQGKILLARGDYRRLEAVARTMPMRFFPRDSLLGRIHAKVFEAICARHLQGIRKALDPLYAAVELSRPDGLALPVAEYGREVVPILRELKKDRPDDAFVERLYALAHAFRLPASDIVEKQKGVLTMREREIVRQAAQGLTNRAIARGMGISHETVKSLLASVYAKMGVANRAQAARAFTMQHGRNIS